MSSSQEPNNPENNEAQQIPGENAPVQQRNPRLSPIETIRLLELVRASQPWNAPRRRVDEQWLRIAEELSQAVNRPISMRQCKNKFETVLRSYRQNSFSRARTLSLDEYSSQTRALEDISQAIQDHETTSLEQREQERQRNQQSQDARDAAVGAMDMQAFHASRRQRVEEPPEGNEPDLVISTTMLSSPDSELASSFGPNSITTPPRSTPVSRGRGRNQRRGRLSASSSRSASGRGSSFIRDLADVRAAQRADRQELLGLIESIIQRNSQETRQLVMELNEHNSQQYAQWNNRMFREMRRLFREARGAEISPRNQIGATPNAASDGFSVSEPDHGGSHS